jgi:hypothetical protein
MAIVQIDFNYIYTKLNPIKMKTLLNHGLIYLFILGPMYSFFGQCSGESYTMTANYDCSTETVSITLVPTNPLPNISIWTISPNPANIQSSLGFSFTTILPFNTDFTITAVEFISTLPTHTYCISL